MSRAARARPKGTGAKRASTAKRAPRPSERQPAEAEAARDREQGGAAARQAAAAPQETRASTGSRAERLRAAVAKVRARGAALDVQRLFMIGGGIILLLGLVFIGLAWYGAAHTPYLFEQVPYLISGGLLGLGLAFAGGFFYFAYWMTRLVRENREQSNRLADAVERLQDVLAKAPVGAEAGGTASNGSFVVTARGTMFHRPDCPIVVGRDDLRRVSEPDGLKPCKVCEPLATETAKPRRVAPHE